MSAIKPLPVDAPFVCAVCTKSSWHPADKAHGYCNRCRLFTGDPALLELLELWRAAEQWDQMPASVAQLIRERGTVKAKIDTVP